MILHTGPHEKTITFLSLLGNVYVPPRLLSILDNEVDARTPLYSFSYITGHLIFIVHLWPVPNYTDDYFYPHRNTCAVGVSVNMHYSDIIWNGAIKTPIDLHLSSSLGSLKPPSSHLSCHNKQGCRYRPKDITWRQMILGQGSAALAIKPDTGL